jgi:hypothetical protein
MQQTEYGRTAANAPTHRAGKDVNEVDQVSSVTLLGLAVAGAAVSLLLVHLAGG